MQGLNFCVAGASHQVSKECSSFVRLSGCQKWGGTASCLPDKSRYLLLDCTYLQGFAQRSMEILILRWTGWLFWTKKKDSVWTFLCSSKVCSFVTWHPSVSKIVQTLVLFLSSLSFYILKTKTNHSTAFIILWDHKSYTNVWPHLCRGFGICQNDNAINTSIWPASTQCTVFVVIWWGRYLASSIPNF